MNGNGGAPYQDLEIFVRRDKVFFRLKKGKDYEGSPGFDQAQVERLTQLHAGDPTEYGQELCRTAFRDGAADGLKALIDQINLDGIRWRIHLNIDVEQPELHQFWWECLYPQEPIPWRLARASSTPLSRYLSGGGRPTVRGERLKVLMVISNPNDLGTGDFKHLPPLDEEKEEKVLRDALKGLSDRFELELQDRPASPVAIRRRLRNEGFHILHVVGHGMLDPEGRGHLLLERDEDEKAFPISETKVGDMVDDLPQLQLVVLASCHSAERSDEGALIGMGPNVVTRGVPAVIAMQDRISETAARSFTSTFYEALGNSPEVGGRVDVAVNVARDDLYMQSGPGDDVGWHWAIPVLFMRGHGQIFDPGGGPSSDQGDRAEARRGPGVATAPPPTAEPAGGAHAPTVETSAEGKLHTPAQAAPGQPTGSRELLFHQLWTKDEDEVNYLFVFFSVPGDPIELSFPLRVQRLVDFLIEQGRADEASNVLSAFRGRSQVGYVSTGSTKGG